MVIAFVQQPRWPEWFRAVVTLVSCLALGAGTAYFEGTLDFKDWVGSSLTILVAALTTYQNFWKKTGVAPAVEKVTSLEPLRQKAATDGEPRVSA